MPRNDAGRHRLASRLYGGAVHGFTHRHATPVATPGVAYHALADERSFAATSMFLAELFDRGSTP